MILRENQEEFFDLHFIKSLVLMISMAVFSVAQDIPAAVQLPNGKLLGAVPGHPQPINNLPTAAAISPAGRYAVFLHSGYGAYTSGEKQSLSVLDLETDTIADYPDDRLGQEARQTFFLGLVFSGDGKHLYASLASKTDPLGKRPGSTGNGVAVFAFEGGHPRPEGFFPIPPRTEIPRGKLRRAEYKDVTYPAGLSIQSVDGEERLLVACNNSDEAVFLKASDGKIVHRYDLSTSGRIPASLPYTTAITPDGKRGFVSLWNDSTVAELDLTSERVLRLIPLEKPLSPGESGSHPTALLLNPDGSRLFVALTNRDEIAVLDTSSGKLLSALSTKLPGQKFGGSDPESLALSPDQRFLFSANAISDSVAMFDLTKLESSRTLEATGYIPTEWYPTVVATTAKDLIIASAKGRGSGPSPKPLERRGRDPFPYVAAMTRGSLARLPLADLPRQLAEYTAMVIGANIGRGNSDRIPVGTGGSRIRHVIYIIRENRTYDQILGDLGVGDGDSSLTMYGEEITPNQHQLARQFGVLDNFYVSGDVSGDGHIWSTAASISDYVAKTWPINYRGREHSYDSEGRLLGGIMAEDGVQDLVAPTGGYLWKNLANHGISYRHYGEFVVSRWCQGDENEEPGSSGPSRMGGGACSRKVIKKGELLEKNVGEPRGGTSPYPWAIPVLRENVASELELRDHFDPHYADFELAYPDQLRVDEFLNEFTKFVADRKQGRDTMPAFILLRLPNDHTAGGTVGMPTPSASIADNDLAIGRIVDALSHGPYWDDTAILTVEDDAQDGPDHVDTHRSIALVISKYSPLGQETHGRKGPFVDHTFYTTINMVRTIEALLEVPAMNVNDGRAATMAPLFSGPGTQPPFTADFRNRNNGLIYQMNTKPWKEGAQLDFSRADAVDTAVLNRFLWHDRMGKRPMPVPAHNVFQSEPSGEAQRRLED